MRRFSLRWPAFVLVAAVVVGGGIVGLLRSHPDPDPFPDFSLTDEDGRKLERSDLIGSVWLASFLSTSCTEGCPVVGGQLRELQGRLPEKVRLVSFVMETEPPGNPAGDYPGTLLYGGREQVGQTESHHTPVLLVDRAGKIRGRYPLVTVDGSLDAAAGERLFSDARFQVRLASLPLLNATLNASSAFFLVLGFLFIRRRIVPLHLTCMVLALLATGLFLVSYLYYHHHAGSVGFVAGGWVRPVYFTILISHTVLAAIVAPLAGTVLYRAVRKQFGHHRKLARWTLPVWLYVSVSGVLIYLMLYVWFPRG